jgi:hypothetical protein
VEFTPSGAVREDPNSAPRASAEFLVIGGARWVKAAAFPSSADHKWSSR